VLKMLVVDVKFAEFKEWLIPDTAFLWTETINSFILLKPRGEMLIRTMVTKKDQESDEFFKVKELYKHTAKYCLGFVIDGNSSVIRGIPSRLPEDKVIANEADVNVDE